MTKRIALITGGARGIGRAIALDLAAHGWSIAICYRTSMADAEATKAGIISAADTRSHFNAMCRIRMRRNNLSPMWSSGGED